MTTLPTTPAFPTAAEMDSEARLNNEPIKVTIMLPLVKGGVHNSCAKWGSLEAWATGTTREEAYEAAHKALRLKIDERA